MENHLARIEQHVDKVENWERLPEKPLVSVAITTYNHEDFIADAIDGALMQETDFPYEIIIAEDNSTDRTREIVLEYREQNPESIRLRLAQENLFSKNYRYPIWGIHDAARGKYVAQCEGDDYWTDPTKLQRQIDLLDENPKFAGSFHQTRDVAEDGSTVGLWAEDAPEILSAEDTICTSHPHFHTSSFVCRTSAIEWPGWASEFQSGDLILFSVVAASGKLAKVDRLMSVRRKHPGGLTQAAAHKDGFHERRIRLMTALNEWHGGKFDAKLGKVVEYHKQWIEHNRPPTLLEKMRMKIAIRTRLKKLASIFR